MKNALITLLTLIVSGIAPVAGQVQSAEELEGKSAYIQGVEALATGEYEKARELLIQANKSLDQEASVQYALADAYFSLDDLPNAALHGKQAVEIKPEHKWYRLKLAKIYRSAGRNNATLNELNTLLDYHPDDLEGLYMLADTYKDYGEFLKSNQTLNRIQKLTGPDISLLLLKFRNFESLGVPDSAVAQLEQIRQVDPDNLEVLNMLGEYYSRIGKDSEAKKVLTHALSRNARDPQSLINLAGHYLDEQKWDSASTLLSNFISDPLIEAEKKMNIARFLYSRVQNQPDNIQLRIETSLVLDAFTQSEPDYGPAHSITGEFYAQTEEPEKALENLERANNLLPEDEIAWRQRLQLLLSQNRYDEVAEVGKTANNHVPEDAYIQFFVGSAYMLLNENTEAEQWLENASRAPARRPFKSVIYGVLGDVRANLEMHESSDQAYEMALQYDGENHNAMNNYAYNLSIREEQLEKAKEMALNATEMAPENAAYLDTAGWVYFKLGDYERARRYIKAAIDTGAASAEVLEHMGDVYEKLDNLNEAQKWWKQALESDPERTHLEQKING